MRQLTLLFVVLLAGTPGTAGELEKARDAQDRTILARIAGELGAKADKLPGDANAQYRAAVANSYLSEVAIEQRDKNAAKAAAEAGVKMAQRAVALKGENAEYHRILGTLCGQVIPANALAGALKYGHCALDEVNKSLQLNPNFAEGYLSHGVGNYYLPPQFGGGVELAVKDFQKAIELKPTLAEAHLWLGVAERKLNHNADARKAFEKAIALNPNRVWAKQQWEKTPAQ